MINQLISRWPSPLKRHFPLLVLLVVFVLVVRIYGWAITPFEGPDEPSHFAYVLRVREAGRLPNPKSDFDTTIAQQVGQAPLYYVSAAWFSELRNFGPLDAEAKGNPWRGYPAPETSRDNRNFYLMSENHVLTEGEQNLADALQWTRLLSTLYGMITVIGVYWAGLAIWPTQRGWALLAAIGVVFNPQALHGFAVVSNDVAVMAFGSLTLAGALHLLRDFQNRRLVILTAIFMGLAALSKTSGLALWPVPVAAIILGGWQSWQPKKGLNLGIALVLLLGIAAVVGGWWYVRGAILYDDPFGTQPHINMPWGIKEHPSIFDKLPEFRHRIPELVRELWARFGWRSVFIKDWGYVLPVVVMMLGAAGGLKILFKRGKMNFSMPIGVILLLLLTIAVGIGSLLQWTTISHVVPGRLLLPYYPAFVLLIIMGLRQFSKPRLWVAGAVGGLAVIIVPTTLYPAFDRPPLLDEPPDDLMGEVLDYGQARFLGFRVDDARIQADDRREFTLCWQAEDAPNKIPMHYAFVLHAIGPTEELVGGRESYFGLGNYTLWQPEKSFCDTFDMPISGPLENGQVYRLALTVLEFETQRRLTTFAVDGSEVATSFIGSLISSAEKISSAELESSSYHFEGISLVNYSLSQNGDNWELGLIWGTHTRPGRTYKIFVHVLDANGQQVAQLDPLAGGDNYPTWAWDASERILDSFVLPMAGLPAGEYQIRMGLYDAETFGRLRATDANGNEMPDNAILLDTITLE